MADAGAGVTAIKPALKRKEEKKVGKRKEGQNTRRSDEILEWDLVRQQILTITSWRIKHRIHRRACGSIHGSA